MSRLKKNICLLLACLVMIGPVEAKAMPAGDAQPPVAADAFTDIAGHAHYDVIVFMKDEGVVNGYPDGSFRPDQIVTMGEFIKFFALTVAVPLEEAQDGGHWAEYYQNGMELFGILPAGGEVDLSQPMTYGDMKELVKRLFLTLDFIVVEYNFEEEDVAYYLELKADVLAGLAGYPDGHPSTRAESLAFLLTLFIEYFQ